MKRDGLYAGIIWVILTAAGFIAAAQFEYLPIAAAEEAQVIDDAYRLLTFLAVPVASTVLAFLFYSFFRFRARPETSEDGPPIRTNQPLALGWFVITTALAVFVVFNPGIKGMDELAANPNADLVIQIEGEQWHWNVTYPQHDLSYQRGLQIAMPVDTRVKFEITSKDVIHSLWIPAFRLKEDAVPGRTTEMYITPTETGTFDDNANFRVQCAELCGTGHPRMQMKVLVLELEDFESWLDEAKMMTGN